tara:strand:+ start:1677 stop:2003 length:327 start_codon:yes stop_codon:yes gene_type:complete
MRVTWKQHREKFSDMLMQDYDYSHIMHMVERWRRLPTALKNVVEDKHINGIPLKDWDELAVDCWGRYESPDRRGPSSHSYRVSVLKEAVRIMSDNQKLVDNLLQQRSA